MLLVRLTLGIVFALLGIAGLLLPVLPGWLFLFLGAAMFFPQHELAVRSVKGLDRHAPAFARWLRRHGVGVEQP